MTITVLDTSEIFDWVWTNFPIKEWTWVFASNPEDLYITYTFSSVAAYKAFLLRYA
jgi:hypothetical protein